MAINRKTDDVLALEHHMLDHCQSGELRDELYRYFHRYPFSVAVDLVVDSVVCSGVARLETGAIELDRSLLNESSSEAHNTYLHEVAHLISNDGHTLDFAALAAGLQQRFRCRDLSRRSIMYDVHETTANEWQTSEYAHLQRGGSVSAIADPYTWVERRRASDAAREWQREREQTLWPNLAALAAASGALAIYLSWPWLVAHVLSNDVLMFAAGFSLALLTIVAALKT